MDKPVFDYTNWPHAPREGYQSVGNNRYLTRSLFLETADAAAEKDALWCLSEHEIFAHGKWYPSAWMVYIHSSDEYDALRKICGNVHQWERIKEMKQPKDFSAILNKWQVEQGYIQRAAIKEMLLKQVRSNGPGATAAAKLALTLIDGVKPRGRPKKPDEDRDAETSKQAAADASRVTELFPRTKE